jgi:hypothetical protein
MSRTLSANIQALIADGKAQRTCHLLTFAVGANTFRFTDGDRISHVGDLYLPHLAVEAGPKYTERLRLEPVTVRLQNITLETAKLLKDEGHALQGQEATLSRLYLAAGEAVVLFKGRVSEIEVNERDATLTLAGDLDPTAALVPRRKYSPLCAWDFKDANCGYEDGVDPLDPVTAQPFVFCPKDLLSCQARGRQQRFPGFLTITRELTESVEGNRPDTNDDRALAALFE